MATREEVENAIWKTLAEFGLHAYADALTDVLDDMGELEDDDD